MTITVTALESRLAGIIAALDGSQTTEDLLLLKKACKNTSVDITSVDAAIQVKIDAVSSVDDYVDLLIHSKAAIEEGISTESKATSNKTSTDALIVSESNKVISAVEGIPSGLSYLMPQCQPHSSNLWLLSDGGEKDASNNHFWNKMSPLYLDQSFKTIKYSSTISNSTVTILSLTNTSGVIRNVISPSIESGGCTITVIADGKTYTFEFDEILSGSRAIIGYTDQQPNETQGFSTVGTSAKILTPDEIMSHRPEMGIPFKTSVIVKIHCNGSSTNPLVNSAVTWSDYAIKEI